MHIWVVIYSLTASVAKFPPPGSPGGPGSPGPPGGPASPGAPSGPCYNEQN